MRRAPAFSVVPAKAGTQRRWTVARNDPNRRIPAEVPSPIDRNCFSHLTAPMSAQVASTARGLSGAEAGARLRRYGPNSVPEARTHPWRLLLAKFLAPVPWMLEATVVLQLALGKPVEAIVIATLLV